MGSEKDTNRIHNQFGLSTSSDFKASFVGPTDYTILVFFNEFDQLTDSDLSLESKRYGIKECATRGV